MKVFEVISEQGQTPKQGWKAYCTNTPNDKMSDYHLSQCKSKGHVARDTKKSQLKGDKRVSLDGVRAKSEKEGGWVSATRTG